VYQFDQPDPLIVRAEGCHPVSSGRNRFGNHPALEILVVNGNQSVPKWLSFEKHLEAHTAGGRRLKGMVQHQNLKRVV